ncbi:MAG: 30S ribosomal protein S6 [SAR324 cluster bacterium]|nr:30S ribosomal protein S6 [SAR324 cluster bacterium]MBL7035162.1 30S ribosomal protein S6 [SAR324 cluster bacterium]
MIGYELIFITAPTLSEEDMSAVLKNIKKSLIESGGELFHEYVWGRRRLAYEIAGHDFGVYHAWYFTGTGSTVDELQRQFGYSDDILRHQIVKTTDIDTEAAFLQSLIPPKEETEEKEKDQKSAAEESKPAETEEKEKDQPAENEVKTDETESELKKEDIADDVEEVKSESVEA